MSEHAVLAPSSAEQWGNCPGSVRAQADMPNLESEQTREGTAAHWVMSETLLNLQTVGRGAVCCAEFIGQQAPNGVLIDGKMAEGAQIMVDDVAKLVTSLSEKVGRNLWADLLIEHRVFMPNIHPLENWGTLDCALYVPEINLLFIWDYKHGHRECKAQNNLQLIDYLAGLIDKYQIDGMTDQRTNVVAKIVQPFCYKALGPVSEWCVRLSDLRGEFNRLRGKATEALGADPKLSTGKHCRDCRAVGKCLAARQMGYNYIDVINEPYQMDTMQGADLATERRILQDGLAVAKARLEAIEDELHYRVGSGDTSTGLSLETSAGRLEWTVPEAQAIALANQFGVDASKQGVLTPTQTKAKAPKEVRPFLEQVMAGVTRRPAGKLKLVDAENSIGARAFKRK